MLGIEAIELKQLQQLSDATRGLSAKQIKLILSIASRCDRTGYIEITQGHFAAELKIDSSTLRVHLAALLKRGVLEYVKRRSNSVVYRLRVSGQGEVRECMLC